MPIKLLNGKLLTAGGKLAAGDDCCCGGCICGSCDLPGGVCPHSLSLCIKFDDTDTDQEDFLHFISADGFWGIAMTAFNNGDGTHHIDVYSWGSGGFVEIAIPDGEFFNVFHNICIKFNRLDYATVNVAVTVNASSGSFTMDTPTALIDTLEVGAIRSDGGSHRTISCVNLLGNPDTAEDDFGFPAQSFDSLTGGASIVGGVLRIDEDSAIDSVATKTLDNGYSIDCVISGCCPFTPFFNSADGLFYPIRTTPQFCFPNDCGEGPPCAPCIPCFSGTPVSGDLTYRRIVTTYSGCTNPNTEFGDCVSTGTITITSESDCFTCDITNSCEGSISYAGGLCEGFPDQACDGNPAFQTEFTEELSLPCCAGTDISAALSGLSFCTDCILAFSGSPSTSFTVSDLNVASSSPYSLTSGTLPIACCGCGWSATSEPQATYHEDRGADCGTDPTDTNFDCEMVVAQLDGTYYAIIKGLITVSGVGGAQVLLFYGSSSTTTITNSISCDTFFNSTNINDHFTDCVFGDGTVGSGSQTLTAIASGGTLTLTL
jgi:hypothetical protein